MDDKLLGLDPDDFGTTGLTLHTLIGVAYFEPHRVLPRAKIYGRGGGQETKEAWRLRAVCKVLEMHGVSLMQKVTRGDDADAEFVVWSNEADAWWKPGGCGYTMFVGEAGRFDRLEAERRAGCRSWESAAAMPPEVVVLAPSAELLASPDLRKVMADRVVAANMQAATARCQQAQCRSCGSKNPAEYLMVGCGFRCDDPAGWHRAGLVKS